MKRILVTGAGGFVGQHLCEAIIKESDWDLIYTDRSPCPLQLPKQRGEAIIGNLDDDTVQRSLFRQPVDALIHLAAVPGGAAEADPALSRRINLDTTLDLFQRAADFGNRPRVIYASTIAVLGSDFKGTVYDDHSPDPDISYGYHKAMVEMALNDLSRRGAIDGLALRLPGIVARPPANNGLKSAFMSDVFYHSKQHQPYHMPVSNDGSVWIMSVQQCVQNLLHAVTANTANLGAKRNMNLPCTHVTLRALVAEISAQTGCSVEHISWGKDVNLQKTFASYPQLEATKAQKLGFTADSELATLVQRALALC